MKKQSIYEAFLKVLDKIENSGMNTDEQMELLKDMEQNPFRIFFWLKQKDTLEMTRGRILYYWTVAIKNKLK